MTPQEKAIDLINKERTIIRITDVYNNLFSEDEIHFAKQCALIAVNEILNAHLFDLDEKQYWQQVKTEIITL